MVSCPSCSKDVPAGEKFCPHCGFLMAQPTPPEAAAPTPPPLPEVAPPPPVPEAAPPPPKLAGSIVQPDGSELEITPTMRIVGRVDLTKFVSPADADVISRKHFTVFQEAEEFYILDEGSTNGTLLNGAEIKGAGKKELKDGDEITVAGVLKLKFKTK